MQDTERKPAQITLRLEPENKTMSVDRPKTVLQLLHRLQLRHTACLVIREPVLEGEKRALLTPDQRILPGESITVRKVTSSG